MNPTEKINMEIFKVVSKAISESHSPDAMANHLCQLLVAALEIKGCVIFLLNPESRELEILASVGLSVDYLSKGPIIAEKSIGCTLKGEPVVVTDVPNDKRLQYPQQAVKEGIQTILSIPIIFSSQVIGCLRLYHHESWDVSEKDVDSLVLLAENIALALRYASLLEAVQTLGQVIQNLPFDVKREEP
jgi:signal transduction protein with GAF and PtsI domain